MKAAELLVNAIDSRGAKCKDIAEALHSKTSTFSRHINENSLKAQELVDAAAFLNYKVVLVDAETDKELSFVNRSGSPRVRRQIYAEVYDTAKAIFLCQTEKKDGWWLELYKTVEGKYFATHYTDWEGVDNFITLCPKEYAEKLIELTA